MKEAFSKSERVPLRLLGDESDRPPDDPVAWLQELPYRQHSPGIVLAMDQLEAAARAMGGAVAASVPDPFQSHHIRQPVYLGLTTEANRKEVPHWHSDQSELYLMGAGSARMWAKFRWESAWSLHELDAHDVILVQAEVCHYFEFTSDRGSALVVKNQRPGVGRFPAGKTTCEFCPHSNECVRPTTTAAASAKAA